MKSQDDESYRAERSKWIKIIIVLGIVISLFILLHSKTETPQPNKLEHNILQALNSSIVIKEQVYGSIMYDLSEREDKGRIVNAWVTGYNSVVEQTDNTPCLAANGNICGRKQVVACPRSIELGTWVKIDGITYECMDRLNEKYDDRFDIFFDKDMQGALNYGKQYKEVLIIEN
jgi:hypothetical protein